MLLNNSVIDPRGHLVGFRCNRCGEVKQHMWGNTCDQCHNREQLVDVLQKLIATGITKPVRDVE